MRHPQSPHNGHWGISSQNNLWTALKSGGKEALAAFVILIQIEVKVKDGKSSASTMLYVCRMPSVLKSGAILQLTKVNDYKRREVTGQRTACP